MRDKRVITLRYAMTDQITINGSSQALTFKANSCRTPEDLGGGHQPRNFDELMELYDRWVVLGSTIKVRTFNTQTANPCMVSICTTDSSALNNTTFLDALENNPRTTRFGSFNHEAIGQGGFVKSKLNVAKYTNRRNLADDQDLWGTKTADIVTGGLIKYHVNFVNAGTSDVGLTDVVVELTYRVMFLGPKKFTGS